MHHLDSLKRLLTDLLTDLLPGRHLAAVSVLGGLLLVLVVLPSTEGNVGRPETFALIPPVETARPVPGPPRQVAAPEAMEAGEIAIDSAVIAEVKDVLAERAAEDTALDAAQVEDSLASGDPAPSFVTEVRPGDNLSLIFARAGLSARDVHEIINSGEEARILNRLYPGYSLAFDIDEEQGLKSLEVFKTALESTRFVRLDSGYEISEIAREPEVRQVFKEATITDSLFLSGRRGGMSAPHIMELASMFSGVVDFILDVRAGDSFNVLYEEHWLDGEFIANGPILAAQFVNQGTTYTALHYRNMAGESDYYNPEGESMRKAFLRNPVDFTRISSGFNPNRRHPIHNTIRAHKGTDYAAPNGTPVVSTADGRVNFVGRKGSFGKLVVVQHGTRFETKYAHLSNYAKGIKNGSRVKQGQVIGYVGATGGATGPHLHYEFLMDGVHRNSRTIHDQLPKAESVAAAEMPRFQERAAELLALLDAQRQDDAPGVLASGQP